MRSGHDRPERAVTLTGIRTLAPDYQIAACHTHLGGELPVGFSEKVADKILGGLLAAAGELEQMPPA